MDDALDDGDFAGMAEVREDGLRQVARTALGESLEQCDGFDDFGVLRF